MRNNKPLDYMGFHVFSVSHFECHAEWGECDDEVEVQVFMEDSATPLLTRRFPTGMTLREIKAGTAVFILKELQKVQTKVINFWERYVR